MSSFLHLRMHIKGVGCLSFAHCAIRFSKYGTFRHANKQPRLYHPYNKQRIGKKIVNIFSQTKEKEKEKYVLATTILHHFYRFLPFQFTVMVSLLTKVIVLGLSFAN